MATIMCLPNEVINVILGYSDITIEDIINFRCVCKRFRSAAKYDEYLKKKLFQRWSSAKKLYDKKFKKDEQKKALSELLQDARPSFRCRTLDTHFSHLRIERTSSFFLAPFRSDERAVTKIRRRQSEEDEQNDIKSLSFIETGIICVRQLQKYVSQLIYKHYRNPSNLHPNYHLIDNCVEFQDIFDLNDIIKNYFQEIIHQSEYFLPYCFVIDELKNLVTQSPRTGCDLSERYCNTKILYFMRQSLVRKKWHSYEGRPSRNQLFERIATIVAQWIQPQKDVFYSFVQASLDNIALDARKYLREKHPNHSIFSTSAETLSYWKNHNIEDNYWNEAEGMQIMDALQEYISNNLNFQLSELNDQNGEDTCIDYVLKNRYGQGIILVIIYHGVARRLGLRCDIFELSCRPYKFFIFWKPKYARNSSKNVIGFNEVFEKLPNYLMKRLLNHWTMRLNSVSDVAVNTVTVNREVVTAKEMWQKLVEIVKYQKKYIMGLNFNVHYYEYSQMSKFCLCFRRIHQLNVRPENVKFAVGMIVKHSNVHKNNCIGVIIGWHRREDYHIQFVRDPRPDTEFVHKDLCIIMPLHLCCNYLVKEKKETEQTKYVILTEKNEMCYVGEDAITLTTPKWIDNSEIGRYFCKFEDTYYVPNKMLAKCYPYDAAITAQTTISKNE